MKGFKAKHDNQRFQQATFLDFCFAAAAAKDYAKQESKVTQFNSEVINWDKNKPLQLWINSFLQGKSNGIPGNALS